MEENKVVNPEVEETQGAEAEETKVTAENWGDYACGKMSIETIEVSGFKGAVHGMRKSYRTEAKSDSVFRDGKSYLGKKDLTLMKTLMRGCGAEAKFARCIHVQAEINAPLLFWKQIDTYKVGTTRLSDSTMHNITKEMITPEMFAADCVMNHPMSLSFAGRATSRTAFMLTLQTIEMLRIEYMRAKNTIIDKEFVDTYGQEEFDKAVKARSDIMSMCERQIFEMLPDSFLMNSVVDLNYQVLRNIYFTREGHKLKEWQIFREWIETLPYSEIITTTKNEGVGNEKADN